MALHIYSPDFQTIHLTVPAYAGNVPVYSEVLRVPEGFGVMPNRAVTIQTTATSIVPASTYNRPIIIIDNQGGRTIYLGDTDSVTTTNGITLADGKKIILEFSDPTHSRNFNMYGVTAASTAAVAVWEIIGASAIGAASFV